PYGRGFGPALEAREALEILEGKRFDDLAKKSCELAGILFESVGYARRRQGFKLAKEILQSGEALEKMKEIINAQGKRYECSEKIPKAKFSTNILATASGKIASINIKNCIRLARLAGAPGDKFAGLELLAKEGEVVEKGDILFRLHSSNAERLKFAKQQARHLNPVELETIIRRRLG
ncbi:MAG: thymidine phosphorylase, partial [Candidatus Diapherotrites archaeon]|nr:thymidine phosphorylase [Candidatus Diapherotrites archaeon]